MKLSIIIPVYNVEKYIEKCLLSIYCQGGPDDWFEVIVVNDGTPDNSMDIVYRFSNHTNLSIIEQKNLGLSVARNVGLSVAKGEYVWFVDSDDWLLEGSFKKIMQTVDLYPEVEVISTILENHFEESGIIENEYQLDILSLVGKDYLKNGCRQGASQRFIIKKKFLEKYSLCFEPSILHEDALFGYKMLYLAHSVMIIDKPLYAYRIRTSGSIMSSITIKSANDLLFIHKKLIEFMNKYVDAVDKAWYQKLIYSLLDSIFGFSRNIIHTNEFKCFYNDNKDYIRRYTIPLLKHPKSFLYGLRMYFFPCQYYQAKVLLKKYLRHDN